MIRTYNNNHNFKERIIYSKDAYHKYLSPAGDDIVDTRYPGGLLGPRDIRYRTNPWHGIDERERTAHFKWFENRFWMQECWEGD